MTNDQGSTIGPIDDFNDLRTVTVLPAVSRRRDRGTEDRVADSFDAVNGIAADEQSESTAADGREIREFVPMQRTPGTGPFGPGELWDVTHRPEFIAQLEERLDAAEPVAFVAFGMDRFQQLNLIVGPEAGDVALRNAYRVLRWMLGPSNVAYFGSDCFAALLPYDGTTADAVEAALARLAGTDLSDRLTGVFATASAGMIVVDEASVTADAVLYEAECLLLSAKEQGGNRVAIEQFRSEYACAESA